VQILKFYKKGVKLVLIVSLATVILVSSLQATFVYASPPRVTYCYDILIFDVTTDILSNAPSSGSINYGGANRTNGYSTGELTGQCGGTGSANLTAFPSYYAEFSSWSYSYSPSCSNISPSFSSSTSNPTTLGWTWCCVYQVYTITVTVNLNIEAYTATYACCMTSSQYSNAVDYYGHLSNHEVTVFSPQAYELDPTGNNIGASDSFGLYAGNDTAYAHTLGLKVVPLVVAGDSFSVGNTGLNALISSPATLGSELGKNLSTTAAEYGFDGWQLDWETSLGSSNSHGMTEAIGNITAAALPYPVSLTTYPSDYTSGPFNEAALVSTDLAQVGVQAYTNKSTDFYSWYSNMFSSHEPYPKIQIALGDFSGSPGCTSVGGGNCANPPIAGYCLELSEGGNGNVSYSVAIWPNEGSLISASGANGYSDPIFHTGNWNQWLTDYLSYMNG
jgi:hypothetical protein